MDAFAGVHGNPVDLPVLRYRVASPPLMVNLSTMINSDPVTKPEALLNAVHQRLDGLCEEALKLDLPTDIAAEIVTLKRRNAKKLIKP